MANPSEASPLLELFTIYENPADYPGKFVLRRWVTMSDGKCKPDFVCVVAATIDEARAFLPLRDLKCLGRLPDGDRCIAETWV